MMTLSFLLTILNCCLVFSSDSSTSYFDVSNTVEPSPATRQAQWRHIMRVGLDTALPYETIRQNAPWRLHGLDTNAPGEHRDFIYFAHVPKTAGQSLSFFLITSFLRGNNTKQLSCFRSAKCAESFSGVAPRFDPNFAQDDKVPIQVFSNPVSFYGWANSYDAVIGHFDASWLRVMGSSGRRHHVLTMTILRDPVARILSWFNYMRGKTILSLQCIHLRRIQYGLFNVWLDRDLAWEAEADATNQDAAWFERHVRVVNEIRAAESDMTIVKLCSLPDEQTRIKDFIDLSAYSTNVNQKLQTLISKIGNVNTQFHRLNPKNRRGDQDNTVDLGSLPPMLNPSSLPLTFTEWDFLTLLQTFGMDNYMARMLSGLTPWSLEGSAASLGISNEEMMATAGDALKAFTFVGLAERFDDSIKMLTRLIDFPKKIPEKLVLLKKNPTYKKREPPPGLKERIMEVEWMDLQLHQLGVTLFESRFSNFNWN